ncbi:MAG: hypothetical protein ACRCZK_05220 [Oscillospiraceae bacterium]
MKFYKWQKSRAKKHDIIAISAIEISAIDYDTGINAHILGY